MLEQQNIILAFIYTSLAGLSTLIGAFFVFAFKKCYCRFLPWGLGFSAGIMLYLSFFDLLKEAKVELLQAGTQNILGTIALFFIIGLAIAGIIDMLTHRYMGTCLSFNPQFRIRKRPHRFRRHHRQMLFRVGLFSMVALTLHNFPEGIATFSATTVNVAFGLSIAIAIAIHNIPEGFCIAFPIFHSTGNYKKTILYTLCAGLAEPLGALTAFLFLYPFINEFIMGGILALVAGIMVYVSIDSLLPAAKRMGNWRIVFGSTILGMFVMFLVSSIFLH